MAEKVSTGGEPYWTKVRRHYRKNRPGVWALRMLYVLIFIGVFGDFIANEQPLYCKIEGKSYFPVFRQYAIDLGLAQRENIFLSKGWKDQNYESVWRAPIPYTPTTLDLKNVYKSPLGEQNVASRRYRHWLGTDRLGRDVASGMIRGTRVALLVGVLAMSVALIIGLFLGGLAGFFGDKSLKLSRTRLWLNIIGIPIVIFYAFITRSYPIDEDTSGVELLKSTFFFFLGLALLNWGATFLKRTLRDHRAIALPIDLIVMRLIEVMTAIPGLLILLALLAVLESESLFVIMTIIGLIRWPGIARFIRGELLRVRQLDYIEASKALGLSSWRIMWRHAIPNALTPVLVALAFGVASTILLEASLSFLGLGLAFEEVTWGRLLNASRAKIGAWWLAIFPGFAIFITVAIFNLIGEALSDAINPKLN